MELERREEVILTIPRFSVRLCSPGLNAYGNAQSKSYARIERPVIL
jgi:hypothetical protein